MKNRDHPDVIAAELAIEYYKLLAKGGGRNLTQPELDNARNRYEAAMKSLGKSP